VKPKAKTHLERMGFVDEDLKTKKHDEIMLWLSDAKNVIKVLRGATGVSRIYGVLHRKCEFKSRDESWKDCNFDWDKIMCSLSCRKLKDIKQFDRILKEFLSEYDEARAEVKLYEDLVAKDEFDNFFIHKINFEVPVMAPNGYLIGFVDCEIIPDWEYWIYAGENLRFWSEPYSEFSKYFKKDESRVYIEIKTKIDSIGELLRQINTYRTYKKGLWIVVTPVEGIEPILRSQGILYYKYEG